jgi:hypothetical protein
MRAEVGPAIESEPAKTQAFMAAVILNRVGRELLGSDARAAEDAADQATLIAALRSALEASEVESVRAAMARFVNERSDSALGALVRSLHPIQDDPSAREALTAIRMTLRARLDRELEYAR